MRTGLYSERIRRIIEDFPVGEPFTNENIAGILKKEFELTSENAELITNNKLKRMFDEGKLGRIEKGVYYVPKQTVFGPVKPDYDRYALKTLTMDKNEVIGYESGASFLTESGYQRLFLEKLKSFQIITEKKLPESCHVVVKKPPVAVTSENHRYLQMLDVINNMGRLHIDAENPEEILNSVISKNELDPVRLAGYAGKYYPQKVLPKVIDIIIGDDLT